MDGSGFLFQSSLHFISNVRNVYHLWWKCAIWS